jgi:hypothetical protein
MDDTIFETPTFAEMVSVNGDGIVNVEGNFKDYFLKVKSAFLDILSKNVYFKKIGDFIVPFDSESKKPFDSKIIDSFKQKTEYRKMLLSKNNMSVLDSFPGFHKDPDTLGLILNDEVMNEYEKAENKMILTGRDEELRDRILRIFKFLVIVFAYALQ